MSKKYHDHEIPVNFVGEAITASQSACIDISTYSRKIKFLESPPANVFFRTHQYEFRIQPNQRVFEVAGGSSGFYVRLRLRNVKNHEERLDENNLPLIDVTFEERPHERPPWIVRVSFVSPKMYKWISKHTASEELYWQFDVFKHFEEEFRFVTSKCSNPFRLYSKPEVFLRQLKLSTAPKKSKKEKGSDEGAVSRIDNDEYTIDSSTNDAIENLIDNYSRKRKRSDDYEDDLQEQVCSFFEMTPPSQRTKKMRSSFVDQEIDTGFTNLPKPNPENDMLFLLERGRATPSLEISSPKISQENFPLLSDYFAGKLKSTQEEELFF